MELKIRKWRVFIPLGFGLIGALVGCCAATTPGWKVARETEEQEAAGQLLKVLTAEEVDLATLKRAELAGEPAKVLALLEIADTLVRQGIGYRLDSRRHRISRAEVDARPERLSCSEFVWMVGTRAGLDLGNFHIETKELAYDHGVYGPALVKLNPRVPVRPGDFLVYEYPDRELIREEEQDGKYHAGHVVLVVSVERRIVVGSHGVESTTRGALQGAGYRQLLQSFERWTAGRALKAIYRIVDPGPGGGANGR